MLTFTGNPKEQVDLIADCLVKHYVKQVFNGYEEKSYSTYLKSVSEIVHWAHEFYMRYHLQLKEWNENVLIVWGRARTELFLEQSQTRILNLGGGVMLSKTRTASPDFDLSI